MESEFDVIVIGSGPGGYVCAIRCAQLGLKTAIVEKYSTLGGTCLNVGCIPSKAYLDSSEHVQFLKAHAKTHGIIASDFSVDWKTMKDRVSKVVKTTCDGIQFLMKKNLITVITGVASFKDPFSIEIQGKKEIYKAKNFVIATGSKPTQIPSIIYDKKNIISSTEALNLEKIPKKLLVLGAGAIGLEMGSVYARLGTKVTVIEMTPSIIPQMDQDLGKELLKALRKEGLEFYLSTKLLKAIVQKNVGVKIECENLEEPGKIIEMDADHLLVAVGRTAYTEGLNLQNALLKLNEKKCLEVNEYLQTSQKHIYAIGDVIGGIMLAHKAQEEGVFVAETILGQKPHVNYNLIPNVVYTWPEAAGVGATEQELIKKGKKFKKGSFPFKALGRARASEEFFGLVKILSDEVSDEILGVHMVGPRCADLIQEAVVAMEYRATSEDIARICHPHPTYSEAVKEAAISAWNGKPLHL